MATYDPICLLCSRLRGSGMTCDAFPAGVPQHIIRGESLHLRPEDGDGGLRFRLRDDGRSREAAQRMIALGLLPAAVLQRLGGKAGTGQPAGATIGR